MAKTQLTGNLCRVTALGLGLAAMACENAVLAQVPLRPALLANSALAQKSPKGDWKRRAIPWAKMSAELPSDPENAGLNLNEATRKQIANIRSSMIVFEGVVARFAFVEYIEGAEVNLERAAQGAINNVRNLVGVTELKAKQSELKLDGVPAILVEATYQYQASPVSYLALVAGDGRKLWQATATYKTAMAEQEAVAKRIIESIRLEKR